MQSKFGPYRLERLVGRGGMGSVYVGEHEGTGEQAAIKILAGALADDSNFRSRFLVEIETLRQLRHPGIVQILGDGEEEGQLFYAMEYVDGKSLQEMLQAGHRFSWRDVIRLAIDICSALKHAHDCGVIHRDLKPANLLYTPDGRVKLTDFGIAKLFGATHRTAAGSVVGTADYMAPEQADGQPVTNRTDLYSLGAVMFTLLARRAPFQGGTLAQVVHKLKFDEAPSVRHFAPAVPIELDQLIHELLRKDPQQRVATALALTNRLRAMEHALADRPDAAPDAGATRLAPDLDQSARNGKTAPRVAGGDGATELVPTKLDREDSSGNESFSWNDATVDTSAAASPSQTEGPPTPTSRFTPVEKTHVPRPQFAVEEHDSASNLRAILGTALLLAALIVGGVWSLWPTSPDTLYQRILTTSQKSTPADAWKDIDQFLKRYPEDPRAAQVRDWQRDVESDWLESRLRVKKRKTDGLGIEPYEQLWLQAYLTRHESPASSRAIWQSILERYGDETNPSPSLETILDLTRHQLKRATGTEGKP